LRWTFFLKSSVAEASAPRTKALLLSTYAKLLNLYPEEPELVATIRELLRTYSSHLDAEIQQRAVEYHQLQSMPELMQKVWDVMPPFDEKFERVPTTETNNSADVAAASAAAAAAAAAPITPPQQAPVAVAPPVAAAAPVVPAVNPYANLPAPRNLEAFNRLCLVPEGVLHQDEFLQIGLRSVYQQSFGRLMLYYGNVTPTHIANIQIVFPQHPALTIQAQAPALELGPGLQMQQALVITCNQEFKDPPQYVVSFVANGQQHSVVLLLPVIATKFMEPLPLNKDEFFMRWKQITGAPLEQQMIIKLSGKAVEGVPYMEKLLGQGFKLGVLQGVDNNACNLVAASVFHSSTKQVVCLLRLENNPQAQMCRLTIRSFHAQITDVLRTLLVAQLGDILTPQ